MAQQVKGEFDVKRSAASRPATWAMAWSPGISASTSASTARWMPASVVHMLAVGTEVPGSAAYVAIERVSGSLQGRSGTFFMQHNGIMDRGVPTLSLSVVPDSGTGELTGLSGRMAIDIVDGKHYYTFDYVLGDAQ